MQVLYASEVGGETLEQAAETLAREEPPVPPDAKAYGLQLARTVRMRAGEIDRLIGGVSDRWDVTRLAVILRMAVAELLAEPDVPVKVCLNEAVEIARKFSTEDSSRFVNGVLDAVARELQNLPSESHTESAQG
jgi:N utilization substance protein B